jgi:uncharacterized protein YcbX
MHVSDLYIYPIKSCRGIQLSQAEVTLKGFRWDREMMLVDAKGKFITQREYPQLATVSVTITGDNFSLKTAQDSLTFQPSLTGKKLAVQVWRSQTIAIDQGEEIAQWFENILNIPCRLVRQSPDYLRPVNPEYAGNDHTPVSFADGYPILLTNTASLEDLNQRLVEPVPMNRFRPNIVISSDRAFSESSWQKIAINQTIYSLVKPCSRCIITTTDQETGMRNSQMEPLKTLSGFRSFPGGIMFGENVIPETTGIIKVGDTLAIL